jgi:hypothetical protein
MERQPVESGIVRGLVFEAVKHGGISGEGCAAILASIAAKVNGAKGGAGMGGSEKAALQARWPRYLLFARATGPAPGATCPAEWRSAMKGSRRKRRPKKPGADRRRLGGTSGFNIFCEKTMVAAVQSYRKFVDQA